MMTTERQCKVETCQDITAQRNETSFTIDLIITLYVMQRKGVDQNTQFYSRVYYSILEFTTH